MRKLKKEKIRKESSGITLVALVVTIVVLLILAGITIVYVFGDNGVFGQTSQAKIQTELGKIEERAQTIYSEKLMETASETLNTTVATSTVIRQLESEGYPIETRGATAADVDVSLDQTSVTIDKKETAIVKLVFNGSDDGNVYYVKLEGKYYKMQPNKGYITIEREASTPTGEIVEPPKLILATDSNHATDIVTTVEVKETENSVTITSGEKYGETIVKLKYGEKELSFTVKVQEKESDWAEIAKWAEYIATHESEVNGDGTSKTANRFAGDTKPLKVGDTFKVYYGEDLVDVEIIDFLHDDLADGVRYKSDTSKTKAGITFDFKDCIGTKDGKMNTTNTNAGGWASSYMRTGIPTDGSLSIPVIRKSLSENLKKDNIIKKIKKGTYKYEDVAPRSLDYTDDDLWLLSEWEVFGTKNSSIGQEGEQYAYYKASGNRVKKFYGYAYDWWLRSPFYNSSYIFCYVGGNGHSYSSNAGGSIGVCPGFCI